MNILYKYCNCLGCIKILSSLELKLPFISDVNDPYECRPRYVCGDDTDELKKKIRGILKERGISCPNDLERSVEGFLNSENRKINLIANAHKVHEDWNKENCLLSVSKTAKNPPMWAYYASNHQGMVIGIDYDIAFCTTDRSQVIQMLEVKYPEERQKIDILKTNTQTHIKTLITKSSYWKHEEEMRCVFAKKSIDAPGVDLETLQAEGLTLFKEFNGKKTWFLKLNPLSIKEVIFGVRTEESLKSAVKRLVKDLPNVKLYQARESETYEFDLIELSS